MMKRWIWVIALALVAGSGLPSPGAEAAPSDAGEKRLHWVFLDSSGGRGPISLSERAVARLEKRGRSTGEDPRDRAVTEQALAPILERGLAIRRVSRWLRAASVWMTPEEAREVAGDPRVRDVRPVNRFVREKEPLEVEAADPPVDAPSGREARRPAGPGDLRASDYGGAFDQLEMLGVADLHSLGYSGAGVMVAVFDGGFYKEHASLNGLDLVAERDFVCDDDDTQYDPGDPCDTPRSNDHGTYTWSALGGYSPGKLIGPAFGATFVLAKTEDVTREIHLEEDNYIAALEWADSLGADIVSTSLGYRQFDNGDYYSTAELDGETIPITIAADIAADRGMLVVTAMGNEGPDESSIVAPADGKRVCGVGAVDRFGVVANFSSRGPTGDGRVKPDILALGVLTYCASASSPNVYGRVNGTSLSTPLIGGLAALLLEGRPDWGPDSVLAALRRSGSRSHDPNSVEGWGIADGPGALRVDASRLRIAHIEWEDTDEGNGDGIPNWGEAAEMALWIRNDGLRASAAGSLAPAGHDPQLELLDSLTVALAPIAPGDSLRVVLGRRGLTGGPGSTVVSGFVTIDDGGRRIDRRLDLLILPSELLARFDATVGSAGEVDLEWEFGTEAVTGVRLLREEDGGEPVPIHDGTLRRTVEQWRDHPGKAGEFRYYIDLEMLHGQLVIRQGPLGVLVSDAAAVATATPYPNPVGLGGISIPFSWPRGGPAILEIYAVTGRRVAQLETAPGMGGIGIAHWNLEDDTGERVSSGLYLIRLKGAAAHRVVVAR